MLNRQCHNELRHRGSAKQSKRPSSRSSKRSQRKKKNGIQFLKDSCSKIILFLIAIVCVYRVMVFFDFASYRPVGRAEEASDIEPPTKELVDGHNANDESIAPKEDSSGSIPDFYSESNRPTNPPRPPQSVYVEGVSSEQLEEFWEHSVSEHDRFDHRNVPSADSSGRVYLMNYIFDPSEQMLSIFLLTAEYLDPDHGLHAWPRESAPDSYRTLGDSIYSDYEEAPPFACAFRVGGHLWISRVDFVPNNTTMDGYVNDATEILRCDVPMASMQKRFGDGSGLFFDPIHSFTLLLTQKWKQLLPVPDSETHSDSGSEGEVHAALSFQMGLRSGVRMKSRAEPLVFSESAHRQRHLTLCTPPISEPLPGMAEFVAHYISNIGVEHIFIGTHFWPQVAEENHEKLMQLIRPWFDSGLITIWPHEQRWLRFTDKAKSHWLNQCLYFAKASDSFVLSLDPDEFLVLNEIDSVHKEYDRDAVMLDDGLFAERRRAMTSVLSNVVRSKVAEFDVDHWCWFTFQSWRMWQLLYPDELFVIRRFAGREAVARLTWSKAIWNTKHLHYTGYHGGGACSAQNHDWKQPVNDWRESVDTKHVYRFDPETEGALFHFYNSRHIRIEPKDEKMQNPWGESLEDSRMRDVYWLNIEHEFKRHKVAATYPNPAADVMESKYYKEHYGEGENMLKWVDKSSPR